MHAEQSIDRDHVITAAIELIDRDGISALTMRNISSRLDLAHTQLAEIFPRLDDLLDGIVDSLVDELFADPEAAPVTPDWQEYLQRIAHAVRGAALAHPQVFPLVATRPPAAPWLRPPLRSLRWVEAFLESLVRRGFSDRAAVQAYRAFSSFLLGHLMLEVSALGVNIGPTGECSPRTDQTEVLAEYPTLARLQEQLAQNDATTEFEESLESLLDRLANDGLA